MLCLDPPNEDAPHEDSPHEVPPHEDSPHEACPPRRRRDGRRLLVIGLWVAVVHAGAAVAMAGAEWYAALAR